MVQIQALIRDMELVDNNYLKDFYNRGQNETKICSEDLFDVFFSEVTKIDLDSSDSKLDIGSSYRFVLESNRNSKLRIIFDLWDSQVNIYLGQEEVHYADDATIKNESDILEFREQLSLLLTSRIDENLFFKNGQLKKYKYQFHHQQSKEPVIFTNSSMSLFSSKAEKEVSNNYEPWLER
jgi:hypothetical protein